MGKLDLAIANYNSALAVNPKLPTSLYGRGLAEEKSDSVKATSDVVAALAIDPRVADNFRKWGVTLAPPDAVPANATIQATLTAEILKALEKLPAYQTITGLYERNKSNPAWLKSAQGLTAARLQRQMRSDAAAIVLEGPKDDAMVDYTVGGVKVSDANIRAVDLEGDPSYRAQIADLIAQTITQQAPVKKFLSTLAPLTPPLTAAPSPTQPDPAASAAARLQQTCNTGNPLDCIQLAQDYTAGTGVTKNAEQANALLLEAAAMYSKGCDGGDLTACIKAGNMWMKNGDNSTLANPLYRKACDGGNSTGCVDLGVAYSMGRGVSTDNAQAVSLFEKSCNGGDPSGCLKAGLMYEVGLEAPVAQDLSKAVTMFSRACYGQKMVSDDHFYSNPNEDIALGCEMLGVVFRDGHGVRIDSAQAATYFRKACDLGESGGCSSLKELGQ